MSLPAHDLTPRSTLTPGAGTFTRADLENQTLKHVENWLVYYLARIEEQYELEPKSIAVPRSWRVTNSFARNPEDALPFVDVVSPGTNPGRKPRRDGDGEVTAWWMIAVGAAVTANDTQAAKDLAGFYGAAIRRLMLEMPDLGGWANGVEWEEEGYDDYVPKEFERTVASVRQAFTVEVPSVVNVFDGPPDSTQPPEDPYADAWTPGEAHPVMIDSIELRSNDG